MEYSAIESFVNQYYYYIFNHYNIINNVQEEIYETSSDSEIETDYDEEELFYMNN
jgi:hypothetical protein